MAAFHQRLFHFKQQQKEKKEMRHMSKSALAASFLIWQHLLEMPRGWRMENVLVMLCTVFLKCAPPPACWAGVYLYF